MLVRFDLVARHVGHVKLEQSAASTSDHTADIGVHLKLSIDKTCGPRNYRCRSWG